MRRPGSDAPHDSDVMEVVLVEDETRDEFLDLLREIALAAVALRAVSPGDPREERPDGGDPRGEGAGALSFRTSWRRWALAAVALLTVVAVATTVVDARNAAAAAARLAADPGVLQELDGPPTEAWRTSGPDAATRPPVEPAGAIDRTLPDGSRVIWSTDGERDRGRVVVRGGSRSYALPGPVLLPAVTDGSVPRTLVVVTGDGTHLRGIALLTGDRLWSTPRVRTGPVEAVAQVDGVLVLDEGTALTTLDVRTGQALWTATVEPAVAGHGLTDGRVLLLPERDTDGDLVLVARRLTDGTELWHTDLPVGTAALTVVDHELVLTAADVVVGLAGPRKR
ncbi:PQQ-binding-like beta-propeller repeat protein [Actinotalea sp. Marseille-Q4924]|uniref:outer membrane protein assembly factor BamB family protein n=1 Tax=Actinotalea sp. Marseille-Q4924 TaxID=2866571 RepID=UPI001CE49415|nr:PQQ-binding-like beta-propeller repeat protein [Actinotalea sp. Marseille-Q4924]